MYPAGRKYEPSMPGAIWLLSAATKTSGSPPAPRLGSGPRDSHRMQSPPPHAREYRRFRRSIRPDRKPGRMWVAHLICSDGECTDELELVVADLDEVERVGCACGHSFVLVSVSDVELV
jgi:hypothetical protein